jgi:hypothetical protein
LQKSQLKVQTGSGSQNAATQIFYLRKNLFLSAEELDPFIRQHFYKTSLQVYIKPVQCAHNTAVVKNVN